jgi:glycosyltransferase involved in cell wall biosynthesis
MPDGAPWPRLTIVTPSFNQRAFLEETLRSVLLQGYPDLEYIVVDGGSTDGSVELLERYSPWLSYWVSERDRGYADALNKGFARATGALYAWINSSDFYQPGAFARAVAHFRDASVGMIYGNDYCVEEDGRVRLHARVRHDDLRAAMLFGRWTPLQDATFWRAEVHRTVGGLDASLRYAADFDFFLRVSLVTRCLRVDDTFSSFRLHAAQLSSHAGERGARYQDERQRAWRAALRASGLPWYRLAAGLLVHVPLTRYRQGGLRSLLTVPAPSTVRLLARSVAAQGRAALARVAR